jgi:hypothetical protein
MFTHDNIRNNDRGFQLGMRVAYIGWGVIDE